MGTLAITTSGSRPRTNAVRLEDQPKKGRTTRKGKWRRIIFRDDEEAWHEPAYLNPMVPGEILPGIYGNDMQLCLGKTSNCQIEIECMIGVDEHVELVFLTQSEWKQPYPSKPCEPIMYQELFSTKPSSYGIIAWWFEEQLNKLGLVKGDVDYLSAFELPER